MGISLLFLSLFIGFSSSARPPISSHGGLHSDSPLSFENLRLRNAYTALQAWKRAISSDPLNLTANWLGSNVCSYSGVYCAPAPDDLALKTLGLLTDLAVFHINTNSFCGAVPDKFRDLKILFELDLSNNRFAGAFPLVVLDLPSLKFLDLRFNEFKGTVPRELFDKDLDAIFINHNMLTGPLPGNFGNSPVSAMVLADNKFGGCVPSSLGNMAGLEEIILSNNGFRSCLPAGIGRLKNTAVFDVSFNEITGPLPEEIGEMVSLEQLNVAHNKLSGGIPASLCGLPKLKKFIFSDNVFRGEVPDCLKKGEMEDRGNCLPERPGQRSRDQCKPFFLSGPADCRSF
ncbi:hypothetical protein GQ457_07G017700 [Hibiscus cannabinus]